MSQSESQSERLLQLPIPKYFKELLSRSNMSMVDYRLFIDRHGYLTQEGSAFIQDAWNKVRPVKEQLTDNGLRENETFFFAA